MNQDQIIISVLVFFAVICAVLFLRTLSTGSAGSETTGKIPFLYSFFGGAIFFFGKELGWIFEKSMPKRAVELNETIRKANAALTVKDIYGAQIFFGIMGGFLGAVLTMALEDLSTPVKWLCVAVFAIVGMMYPLITIQKLAEERTDEILHDLPFAIDLISSSMNAGLDFGSAVRYLIASGEENQLNREFAIFLRDVGLGKTRTDALVDMQNRINITEFTRFVSAVSYGMDSGSSIIEIMRIQSEEIRRVKFARAEQQAAKAPAKMIVPMALFIFPSMFIIILVPVFINMRDSGALAMFGK